MEIEILTTKKKLTKSLVSQMKQPSFDELTNHHNRCLGYMVNVKKGEEVTLLIQLSTKEYRVVATGWLESDSDIKEMTRFYRRDNYYITFDEGCEAKKYVDAVERFYYWAKMSSAQIYI